MLYFIALNREFALAIIRHSFRFTFDFFQHEQVFLAGGKISIEEVRSAVPFSREKVLIHIHHRFVRRD